jgi:hypothetical protein
LAAYVNGFHHIDEIHTFDHDLLIIDGEASIAIPIIEPSTKRYPPSRKPFSMTVFLWARSRLGISLALVSLARAAAQ